MKKQWSVFSDEWSEACPRMYLSGVRSQKSREREKGGNGEAGKRPLRFSVSPILRFVSYSYSCFLLFTVRCLNILWLSHCRQGRQYAWQYRNIVYSIFQKQDTEARCRDSYYLCTD